MVRERSNQLLGELLTEAGLLQIDDLREAVHIARNQSLPIGKVLVMSGYVSKELLEASIEVQSRLKDNLLDYDLAIKALNIVSTIHCSLEKALSRLGIDSNNITDSTTNRLGELLLGSSLLSQADYDRALAESQRCGLPLGRVLINLKIVTQETIDNALGAQKLLRGGQTSKEEAIESLIESKERKLTEQEIVLQETLQQKTVQAEQSGQKKAGAVIEENTEEPKLNKPAALNSGKELAQEAKNKAPQGVFTNLENITLHHVLLMAGLVQTSALESAIKEGLKSPEVMAFILKRSEILEDFVIDAAQECCQLIATGQLKPEQAIIALHQCQRTRNSIKDCLKEFGWMEKSQIVW